jgi:hypothetical protein
VADERDKPLSIEYQSPRTVRETGNSPLVRCIAAGVFVMLVALIVHFAIESRRTLGGIDDWALPIAAASGGACYCFLIALNIAGRKKQ